MSPTSNATEEPKQKLPVGHPKAGYVAADVSYTDGAGTLPPDEQAWADDRDEAREADAEAVAAHEDKTAKEEKKAAEGEAESAPKTTAKTTSS